MAIIKHLIEPPRAPPARTVSILAREAFSWNNSSDRPQYARNIICESMPNTRRWTSEAACEPGQSFTRTQSLSSFCPWKSGIAVRAVRCVGARAIEAPSRSSHFFTLTSAVKSSYALL
jgi:hypothetical protein